MCDILKSNKTNAVGEFMAIIGYARVSTAEQNEVRQIKQLNELNADKIFLDKMSGSNDNRPQLRALREYIREGDTVIVTEYARLARSVRDLLSLVDEFTSKGVGIVSIKENFDTSTPQGKLILTIFAGLAEFEREMILQRQKEGIEIARRAGKYKGRRPIPIDEDKFKRECEKWVKGEQTAVETMKRLDMLPNRFYRHAKKYGYSKEHNNG